MSQAWSHAAWTLVGSQPLPFQVVLGGGSGTSGGDQMGVASSLGGLPAGHNAGQWGSFCGKRHQSCLIEFAFLQPLLPPHATRPLPAASPPLGVTAHRYKYPARLRQLQGHLECWGTVGEEGWGPPTLNQWLPQAQTSKGFLCRPSCVLGLGGKGEVHPKVRARRRHRSGCVGGGSRRGS